MEVHISEFNSRCGSIQSSKIDKTALRQRIAVTTVIHHTNIYLSIPM